MIENFKFKALRLASRLGIRIPHLKHHRDSDGTDYVSMTLRVWLFAENDMYVAQGIDIDYVASGFTLEQARRNFAEGLIKTVELNLKEFGSLKHFVKAAPPQIIQQYYAAVAAQHKGRRPEVEREPLDELSRVAGGWLPQRVVEYHHAEPCFG